MGEEESRRRCRFCLGEEEEEQEEGRVQEWVCLWSCVVVVEEDRCLSVLIADSSVVCLCGDVGVRCLPACAVDPSEQCTRSVCGRGWCMVCPSLLLWPHVDVHTFIYICTHSYTFTLIHTHTHIHIHIHIHITHTHA